MEESQSYIQTSHHLWQVSAIFFQRFSFFDCIIWLVIELHNFHIYCICTAFATCYKWVWLTGERDDYPVLSHTRKVYCRWFSFYCFYARTVSIYQFYFFFPGILTWFDQIGWWNSRLFIIAYFNLSLGFDMYRIFNFDFEHGFVSFLFLLNTLNDR